MAASVFIMIIQAALEEERDKLLAEKASWTEKVPAQSTAAPPSEDANRLGENEKSELLKARDNALAELKVCASPWYI